MEMISAITSSTTLRVLENGALNTTVPRSAAAARSIWLVPMQKAPMASRSGAASRTLRGHCGLGADAEHRHPAERIDQLRLVQRSLGGLDGNAALDEQADAFGMDVLQQQSFHARTV